MFSNVALFSLPLLAAGAQHGLVHKHVHKHGRGLEQYSSSIKVITCTDIVWTTVTVEPSTAGTAQFSAPAVASTTSTALANASLAPLRPSPDANNKGAPKNDKPTNSNRPFQELLPGANTATIKNSCTYPVYISSISDPKGLCSGDPTNRELLSAKSTYTEPLRTCKEGGISLKVSKHSNGAKPMQFEYAVPQGSTEVSYDISYLDCMNNASGEKDLSECVGHEGGIQAMGGGVGGMKFECPANEWCNEHAYVVPEFGYLPGAPVGTVGVESGVAFELCAGFR